MSTTLFLLAGGLAFAGVALAEDRFERDVLPTAEGDLAITFIGHASLAFDFGGKRIYVDPDGRLADYAKMPKADLVLVTHEHGDHLDPEAIRAVRKDATEIVMAACAPKLPGGIVMTNGEARTVGGLKIEAVPAYNIEHKRPGGEPFHPKGRGNGYIVTFGGLRVYIAGDTENTPDLKALKDIDVAFLPMNLPYTMTPEMVADAARALKPKILYPYHYGDTDTSRLATLLEDEPGIEVRVRRMK